MTDVFAAATRTEMAAIPSPSTGASCELTEAGREGQFIHLTDTEFEDRYGFPLAGAIAADTLQGIYVETDTGAWVRVDDRITPFMFGGVTNYKTGDRGVTPVTYGESATPGSRDGILVDSRAACQAVLDMLAFHLNRELVADFSGGLWGITKRGDAGAHDLDGLVIDQRQEYARRFIGGEFRGIGSGRNLIYVDEGSFSKFEGKWHIRSLADLGSSPGYAARQWENGIWLRNSSQCRWDEVKVAGFLRWGIEFDPEFNLDDYNNNIGARFSRIYCNNNGSACDRGSLVFEIHWTASSRTPTTGGANNVNQRTNWTLEAGHEILRVGDIIRGPNGQYHTIMEKADNVISVNPWSISTAATGTITSCHGGAVLVHGKDAVGAGADSLTSVNCGVALALTNVLHGTEWGQVIQEGGGLGTVLGQVGGVGGLGHTIAHMHSEGVALDILAVGNLNVGLNIGSVSAWAEQDYSNPFKECLSLAPNDGVTVNTSTGLPWIALFIEGQWLTSGTTFGNSSVVTKSRAFIPKFSNNPAHNHVRKVADTLTLTLKYFEGSDRNLRNAFAARLEVTGTAGGAPTGAITVNLDPGDAAAIAWAPATAYAVNDYRTNDGGKVYKVTTAGTSAGSGGPTGTGTSISDGGVTWTYVQPFGGITFLGGGTTYTLAAGAATGPVVLDFWLDTNSATLRWLPVGLRGLPSVGPIYSSGGPIGYTTGAGGAQTQLTSKTTSLTLNKVCGQFTTNNAALAAGARATFQVNNSNIAATDTLLVNLQSGQATEGTYRYWIEKVGAGSFKLTIENLSGGSLSEALVFNFSSLKAVNA